MGKGVAISVWLHFGVRGTLGVKYNKIILATHILDTDGIYAIVSYVPNLIVCDMVVWYY